MFGHSLSAISVLSVLSCVFLSVSFSTQRCLGLSPGLPCQEFCCLLLCCLVGIGPLPIGISLRYTYDCKTNEHNAAQNVRFLVS